MGLLSVSSTISCSSRAMEGATGVRLGGWRRIMPFLFSRLTVDACRPGIILYGYYPSDEVDINKLAIKPVMSVKANIIHLKDVPEGFSVGYGRKFISERPSKIATLALGYADGYPRPYSQYAKVLVNGCVAPVAGNICMDQCMVDVTDVPDVKVGDEVIIMGSDGKNTISAEDIAKATGTTAPAALRGLEHADVRFDDVVEIDGMEHFVEQAAKSL